MRRKPKAVKPEPAVHDDVLAVVNDMGVVRHGFPAGAPMKPCLAENTEHPIREGKLRPRAVKDCFSTTKAGHSLHSRMESSLTISAMRSAIMLRSPDVTIVHIDRVAASGLMRWCDCCGTTA